MSVWLPSFSIGVAAVDDQHRSLFEQVAKLDEALRSEASPRQSLRQALEFLARYAVLHFETEERVMREIGFPDLEPHVREHHDFVRRLRLLFPLWEEEESSVVVVTTLLGFLSDWLVRHVTGSDQRIGEYLKASVRT